ncbi:MAG: hypothetical protein PF636_03685 [Actinomycetota bacterium]|jgi:hypothetical protein|nr:hypothetical protein [Actinomycetota bacterium]
MTRHRGVTEPETQGAGAQTGFDVFAAITHILAPPVAAYAFSAVLAGGFDLRLWVVVLAYMWFALRPAIWGMFAAAYGPETPRGVLYLERRDNAAAPGLLAMAFLGLALMDVLSLPGGPHWTNQPRAGFLLGFVAVYMVWVATYARLPHEVREGWSALLGSAVSDTYRKG